MAAFLCKKQNRECFRAERAQIRAVLTEGANIFIGLSYPLRSAVGCTGSTRVLEELPRGLREVSASIPDDRQWRPHNIRMSDGLMSPVSLFFLSSESFLAYQRRLEKGRNGANCKLLFRIEIIPGDTPHSQSAGQGSRPNCWSRALILFWSRCGNRGPERL